jgi:hypothetical protein|tara:strand:- start:1105 stop:1335 length:231 start_codon:yes stop_codon:yes gene_type:complete
MGVDDSNWKQEYSKMKRLSLREMELLRNGADSLASSWRLNAMRNDWMRMKGIKESEPPNVSSSLKEFFQKHKDQGV